MSRISHRLEYAALCGFVALCRALPSSAASRVGRALGDLLYNVVGIRRAVALENLHAAFPEEPAVEIERIAHACYRNFATTAVDFARLSKMDSQEILDRTRIVHPEHLDTIRSMGRGAILLSAHFGNWEWFAALFPAMGFTTNAVAATQRNRLVGALMDRVRTGRGLGMLSADRDLRGVMECLRRNECLVIVPDQDAGRDGVFIDFLGRPASTAIGPVRLARRFGCPILIGFALREPGERVRVELQPPIVVPQESDEDDTILQYTKRWSAIVEQYVRRHPDQWFWMHRRWKTRPKTERNRAKETT